MVAPMVPYSSGMLGRLINSNSASPLDRWSTYLKLCFVFCRTPKEVAAIDQAHDSIVWALAWHPLGHILCSGSNDHSCKFWTRNHPGDPMRDKYNLNTASASILGFEECEDGKQKLYL